MAGLRTYGFGGIIVALCLAAVGQTEAAAAPSGAPDGDAAAQGQAASPDALQQTRLASPTPVASGDYGAAVDIDGDTAIVGEPSGTGEAQRTGVAWVYIKTGGAWVRTAKLTDGKTSGSAFGAGVAIDGDTIVVGAPGAHAAGAPRGNFGAAYVFLRTGDTWTRQAELWTTDGQLNKDYGAAVALDGDTLAVGAQLLPLIPDSTVYSGATYMYVRSGTTWNLQQRLESDDGDEDFFGCDVALDGDTLAVGARKDSTMSTRKAGAVYMFQRSGDTWTRQAKLVAATQDKLDEFGTDVALDGDTVVAGRAFGQSAEVFTRSGSSWSRQAVLTAGDDPGDFFADSVALVGDLALIGAPYFETRGVFQSGGVYAYQRSGTTWSERATITAFDGSPKQQFGSEIAFDGENAMVAADAAKSPSGAERAGAVYILER